MIRWRKKVFGVEIPVGRIEKGGFTLIELMVAISLLTIIMSIVYASFWSVVSTTENARLIAEELRLRQFLARSFTTNLTQAYEDWRPGASLRDISPSEAANPNRREILVSDRDPNGVEPVRLAFLGENGTGAYGPADTLTFPSSAPLMGSLSLPGMLKQVTYAVTRDEDENASFRDALSEDAQGSTLEVRETPLMGGEDPVNMAEVSGFRGADKLEESAEDAGFDSPGWSVPIRTLDMAYYDGEEWLDDWDSIEIGRLPWSVRIRVNFARPKEEIESESVEGYDLDEDAEFELIVPIPAGQGLRDEPPDYKPPAN